MPTQSDKGTQAGKSQLDKAVPMLSNPAFQESMAYSLDNLFPSSSSVSNISSVVQDSRKREFAPNLRSVPFPIFLTKDHSSSKSTELNRNKFKKASKMIKLRGKKAGGKRNRQITKKMARKVKFEERKYVGSPDVQDRVPTMENSKNGIAEALSVSQQVPDMDSF
ncbi:hypothetical protein NDU88_001747 [Pleurodeles waltl]|uniref:Uncharacterized protein n=1 Tax=Pleurodeles waltl TaxID=8319 RepID=A0AAV7P8V6_PLEWA|nr:hypothetical protein NDU88_001747 [Pleurodeles waltl]